MRKIEEDPTFLYNQLTPEIILKKLTPFLKHHISMNKLSFIDQFHIWRRKLRWNRQYKKGRWDYLKNDVEAPRYAKI